jgi:hypothetical protein
MDCVSNKVKWKARRLKSMWHVGSVLFYLIYFNRESSSNSNG